MKLRTPTVVLAALIATGGFLAFVPTASAQGTGVADVSVQIKITAYDSAIKPLSDLASIPFTITYTYRCDGVGLIATPVQIKVVEAPVWASVTPSPATILIPTNAGAPGGTTCTAAPQTGNLLVSTTADAPAFTPANIRVSATAAPNGNLRGVAAEEPTLIRADFFSIVDAVPQTTIQLATPQSQVAYPITISNFGNAQTKIFFEKGDHPATWQVVEPTPVTLDSKQAGGKQTALTVNFMIQTPFRNGYLNEVGSATLKITSSYALDNKVKGDSTQVSTLTTTKGFYVPGFEPLLLLGAVMGMALVLRRRA